jgi:hypothetical protein
MSNILLIAYHFPPLRGSSGIQRTLRFCQYLPRFGWNPVVLTVHPRAYEDVGEDLSSAIPAGVPVQRAFALDAARHLAFRGSYPRLFANPDRWTSWFVAGVVSGLSLIRRHRPRALFSTYPIATAHLIGLALHRLTGIPWVADFRDPMAQEGYPPDPVVWRRFHWLEGQVVRRAARLLYTSPGAVAEYRSRYSEIAPERFVLLENGYDEETFADLAAPQARVANKLILLHSGIVYTSERDPTMLFRALGSLKREGAIAPDTLEVRFRASANDSLLRKLGEEQAITDLVSLVPSIPYGAALEEMMSADALLILQGASCNSQIPAKAYEYLRAGRPIAGLTDPRGDTADLLRRAGLDSLAPLDSADRIAKALPPFLEQLRTGNAARADIAFVRKCERVEGARALAGILDTIPSTRGG